MIKNRITAALFLTILLTVCMQACVQKAYLKTVVFTLTIANKKEVKSAGIRGEGNPLSWQTDFPMKEVIRDSVYTAIVQTRTAFRSSEIKFTVNGEFELKNKPNRKIVFHEKSDTTYMNAVFDQE